MNARLVEIDKTLFDQHLAPLFAATKKVPQGKTLARADNKLVNLLNQQKVILSAMSSAATSSVTRGRHFCPSSVPLSLPRSNKDRPVELAHSGVAFSVKTKISDDRRRMEVAITQAIEEAVDIKKIKMLDAKSKQALSWTCGDSHDGDKKAHGPNGH